MAVFMSNDPLVIQQFHDTVYQSLSSVGTLLLAITGEAVYLTVAGLGTALGLIFGAGVDRATSSTHPDDEEA